MWKQFANKLTLKQIEGNANTYELVVEDVEAEEAFPIVETQFEFADPTAVHKPEQVRRSEERSDELGMW